MIFRGCARKFPFGFVFTLIATAALIVVDAASDDTFDIVLFGGTVIDGTGAPAYSADVGIRGDKIAEIGDLSDSEVTPSRTSCEFCVVTRAKMSDNALALRFTLLQPRAPHLGSGPLLALTFSCRQSRDPRHLLQVKVRPLGRLSL